MDLKSILKESPFCHLFLSLVFVVSGFLVNLLQLLTLLVIRPFSKRLYQFIVCKVVYLHWAQLIFFCDHWSGVELRVCADEDFMNFCGKEHCLILCNHRQDIDWLANWIFADRFGVLQQTKCVMKEELKYVPLIGWSSALQEMVFVKRDFARDKKTMTDTYRGYLSYPLSCLILLFCEGTRFTPEKHAASLAFAKEKGMMELKHHLMPRTKGFVVALEAFDGKLPAIYNITFGVSKAESEPTLVNMIRGKKFIFNFHAKRIPIADVPKDEEGQVKFIHDIYKEKDQIYEYFLENDTFSGYDHLPTRDLPWRWAPVIIEIFWLSVLGLPALYQLFLMVTTGSVWVSATAIGIILALYFVIKYMIAVTMTSRGSTYGSNRHSKRNATIANKRD